MKYISHLDFVRMFHRAVRRADLDMEFSHGFNPHPLMTIALPLSVGVTGDGEYMKIAFAKDYSENEIMSRLNRHLPYGFRIIRVKHIEGKEIDLTKIDRADYTVIAEVGNEFTFDANKFLANQELKVMKKSKSGVKESDIRPYIYDLALLESDGTTMKLSMRLAAGNIYNLKPETVLDAMEKYCDGCKILFKTIHRNSMTYGDVEYL